MDNSNQELLQAISQMMDDKLKAEREHTSQMMDEKLKGEREHTSQMMDEKLKGEREYTKQLLEPIKADLAAVKQQVTETGEKVDVLYNWVDGLDLKVKSMSDIVENIGRK